MKTVAYNRGYDAFYGETWINPYSKVTEPEEWEVWNEGWGDAETDAFRKHRDSLEEIEAAYEGV